jgi:putative ABC transport system substrate-binding protein
MTAGSIRRSIPKNGTNETLSNGGFTMIDRRHAVALLGVASASLALPLAAQPRNRPARVLLFTFGRVQGPVGLLLDAFKDGMRELGYVEGRSVAYELASADGNVDRVDEVSQEVVRLAPDVVLVAAPLAFQALQRRTTTLPIVMPTFADPVVSGAVSSYARPGGNVTGLSNFGSDLTPKRLELLLELMPSLQKLGLLWDATGEFRNVGSAELRAQAQSARLAVQSYGAGTLTDIDDAFAKMVADRVQAVAVAGGPFFNQQTAQIVALAVRHRLPTMFGEREDVVAGGLMSYGQSLTDRFRRAASFVDKIVKGAKAGELPIEQSSKIEMVINLKTLQALGLSLPQSLLLRADEIIR